MIKTTKEMVGWNNCQCGEPDCQTIWRECLMGLMTIIPSGKYMNAFTVKGQGGRDKVQIIPVRSLMEAIRAAEDLSREYGGWL
jgi:hypothetical protein